MTQPRVAVPAFSSQLHGAVDDPGSTLVFDWVLAAPVVWRVPVHSGDGFAVVGYSEARSCYFIYRIDAASGSSAWTTTVPVGGYGSLAIIGDRLAVLTNHVGVAILDWDSGRIRSTFMTDARVRSSVTVHEGKFHISAGDCVYSVAPDGAGRVLERVPNAMLFGGLCNVEGSWISLIARQAGARQTCGVCSTGSRSWVRDLGDAFVASSDTCGVAYAEGRLFAAAGPRLYCLDIVTGDTLWAADLPGIGTRSMPVVADGRVFTADLAGSVSAFDADDGSGLWTVRLSDDGLWSPPSLLGDRVLAQAGGRLYEIDVETGTVLNPCVCAVGQSPYSCVTFSESGRAALGAGDPPHGGLLFGFRTGTPAAQGKLVAIGNEKWQYMSDAPSADRARAIDASVFGAGIMPLDASSTVYFSTGRRRYGSYAIPVVDRAGKVLETALLELQSNDADWPERVRLDPAIPRAVTPFHTGAAIMAGIVGTGSVHEQQAIRDEVDRVITESKSQEWDTWRLAARQVLHDPPSGEE